MPLKLRQRTPAIIAFLWGLRTSTRLVRLEASDAIPLCRSHRRSVQRAAWWQRSRMGSLQGGPQPALSAAPRLHSSSNKITSKNYLQTNA